MLAPHATQRTRFYQESVREVDYAILTKATAEG
ncbi:unnamed protein product [Ectocarpus sp. CCAP 1310/34]|nr:unnamed protein product [Ectocarpus sp. CCAP 1310/34]